MSRARAVSAVAFGLAAAVVACLATLLAAVPNGESGWALLAYSVAFAAVGAAVGALAGPHVAGCRTPWGAVGIGLAVTVVSALVFAGLSALIVAASDVAADGAVTRLGAGSLGWLALYTTLSGVVVSPVGMFAGWLAWRQIRRRRRRSRYGSR